MYDSLNKNVFDSRLKARYSVIVLRFSGSVFNSVGAAFTNALLPYVAVLNSGTDKTSILFFAVWIVFVGLFIHLKSFGTVDFKNKSSYSGFIHVSVRKQSDKSCLVI